MRKIYTGIICGIFIILLSSCNGAEKVRLSSDIIDASAPPTVGISDKVDGFPDWCADNMLPEGCDKIKTLSHTDDRYVLLAESGSLSLDEITVLYREISRGKENISETKANDYYIISWQEKGVELYIKANQKDGGGVTITIDFYNGSRNE